MQSKFVEDGIAAVESGDTLMGLHCFERVPQVQMSALAKSYYAYCLAVERRAIKQSFEITLQALKDERNHPLIHLNLGRIYHVAGQKEKAVASYRRGFRIQSNPLLKKALEGVNPRRCPILPFLNRKNPINVFCGKIIAKLAGLEQ